MIRVSSAIAQRNRDASSAILAARHAVAERPRHLVLAAFTAGLLLAPGRSPGLVLAAAMTLGLARRASVGLLAVAAVAAGAAVAEARLTALDSSPAQGMMGEVVDTRAILLEPARERPTGMRGARVELLDGRVAGAVVAARVDAAVKWPAASQVGDVLVMKGRILPLARYEAFQRRRGAPVALRVEEARATGTRRAGAPGVLDGARRRAERALASGLRPSEAQLLRGMVLGQDDGIEESVREEFRRSGLAHLLSAIS